MKNVLMIDDDPDDAAFFSEALSDLGLSTSFRYVGNGQETLTVLLKKENYSPDVIFMDINMPMTNGWECLRDLKSLAEFRSVPIVMYSTLDIEREGSAPADIGATAFMTKPTSFNELKIQLSRLMQTLFAS